MMTLMLAIAIQGPCDLRAMRFDSPLSYGQFAGFDAPRWTWHAMKVGGSVLGTEAVHRSTGWSRRKSAVVMPLLSIALHVLGNRLGKYRVDWRDWLFDAGLNALPLALYSHDKPVAITGYVAFYAAAACQGSP